MVAHTLRRPRHAQGVLQCERTLKDAGDKVTAEGKSSIQAKVDRIKSVKDGTDVEAIKSAVAELSQEIQKIGQAMYGNQKPDGGEQKSDNEENK